MESCKHCKKTKSASEYYFRLGKPMMKCKECQKLYVRQWSALNKEKMMETRAKYGISKYRTKQIRSTTNAGEKT